MGGFLVAFVGFFWYNNPTILLMKRSEILFSAITVPLDFFALLLAAVTAYLIRYLPAIQSVRPVIFELPFRSFFSIAVVASISWVAIYAITGLYAMGGTRKLSEEISKVFIASSAGLALVLAVMGFSRFLFDSRFIILAAYVLALLFVVLERLIVRWIQHLAFARGIGLHRVVLIGDTDTSQQFMSYFEKRPGLGYRIVDHLPRFDPTVAQYLYDLVAEDKFDEIILVNPNLAEPQTIELVEFAAEHHIVFKYTADLLGTRLTNMEVRTLAGTPVVEIKRTRLDGWGRVAKRIFDIIGSVILIIVTAPIMLLTALAITFDSRGPIFFAYQRIGQHGKPFQYLKFRSMIKDAHQLRYAPEFQQAQKNLRSNSPMLKFQNDPRVTRVGKFIRRWSIDELPELFLVFIGKMSLVGPRPHESEEVRHYQRHHKRALTLKPGITGLSQVSGRSDLEFEDEVKLDTFYIENWSLWLDLQILAKTPWAVIRRREAV